ncbi:sorting nexin-21 [Aplysia californica]|uniref:Sorting nexin-21 n=1 Tax=Aplysia californica TaxID=6500 RepID=A0ABM1VS08_APLCA|nr:sorting nexin-21 [Aplysia californica]XP_035825200.1 sorting nexin-21 [Aplysia californica]
MNSLLNKIKAYSVSDNEKKSLETSRSGAANDFPQLHEENALTDDQDAVFGGIAGTLAIADDTLKSPTDGSKEFCYQVPCEGSYTSGSSVTFEVISAEVIREGRSGHVNYTILINPHRETTRSTQTVVIRRYSDFENLHQRLKKKFPPLMSNISFPRKILTGNFTSQTIAKRSTAFEQYLAHLFSHFEVRYSQEFMEFFLTDGYSNAVLCFLNKNFAAAIVAFEKTLPVLEKLYGDFHPYVCQCLCSLVSCYVSVDKPTMAHACVEVALKCCCSEGSAADEDLRVALMLTAIRLCWTLGKEKTELEKKVTALRQSGVDVNAMPDLRDILTATFRLQHNVGVDR